VSKVAVLASGGLDSAIMLVELAKNSLVYPIYVEAGLVWEESEKRSLDSFLAAVDDPNIQPVTHLSVPVGPILDSHWSVTGDQVPDGEAPDEDMFVPGRNILLFSLAAVWCSTHDVSRIAIGSLGGNPFPDATPDFFTSFGASLSAGLAHEVKIEAPFRNHKKSELIREYSDLPIELSLTCAQPTGSSHCGNCNKCTERRQAFTEAGVEDRTKYLV
jgi:7-cyano-7-deazaguanine synthase